MSPTTIPEGVWVADRIHSSIIFGIDHVGTSTFRSTFSEYAATLRDGVLTGTLQPASVAIPLEDFKRHLLGSDFFDIARSPNIEFRSTSLDVADDGRLTVAGELTIKGTTCPASASGTLSAPLEGLNGRSRIGVELKATLNRFDFGLNWDMKMADGRQAAGTEVTLEIVLEMVQQ
jgi:polyisoprenoid-binding protein YceI